LYSVYIPNSFDPNGDGTNDTFIPKGYFILNNFRVFNNLGEVIFETTDKNVAWNGKAIGGKQIVEIGSYTYQLKVNDISGNAYEYTGSVMLYK
jgi:gliding motility-associated-like protein